MDHSLSRDMIVPDDMSNLMSEKLSMSGFDSFSVGPTRRKDESLIKESSIFGKTSNTKDFSLLSTLRPNRIAPPLDDSDRSPDRNGFATQAISPIATTVPGPSTPTRETKPFRSIFADMSAEQADLSWPLIRRSPEKALEDETVFHSAISLSPGLESPDGAPCPLPRPNFPTLDNTPRSATAFYDCSSATPSPVFASSSSLNSLELRTPSPVGIDLVQPTKAMFDAHSAHTAALATELELYQRLVQSLEDEVAQRDTILAKLNVQALEAEVWHSKYDTLLLKLKLSEEQTPSPTPNQYSEADCTTVAEVSNRDLEIRLSKALADQRNALAELENVKVERELAETERDVHQKEMKEMEQRNRGVLRQMQGTADDLRLQHEGVTRREPVLHEQLAEEREEAKEAKLERDQVKNAQNTVKRDIAEREKEKDREIARLLHALDQARADGYAGPGTRQTIMELEEDLVAERKAKEKAMARLQGVNEARLQVDREKQEVSCGIAERQADCPA